MSELSFSSLSASLARAKRRFATEPARPLQSRRSRGDRGKSRLESAVDLKLAELLGGQDRPSLGSVHRALVEWCERHGHHAPSRATVYNAVGRASSPTFELAELPDCVRRTLHNVGGPRVPGHQIVFAAFNYGDTDALSYAASLPWLCLEHAMTMRGFRPKSLALLQALAICRGIRE